MNKKELVEAMAGAADISKASAEKALNGMLMFACILEHYFDLIEALLQLYRRFKFLGAFRHGLLIDEI